VIAANIVVFTGSRGIYYYGASSSQKEDKKHMAPYLLQWISLLETKRREIPLYDFLGVADPSNVHDRLKGVTEFKEKFGGTTLQIGYSATYPLNVRGKLFLIFRNIREKIRR
jgi:lipid II:glycine glycyltransferase (peptidoglycan interpeptide bridge formation enzyme)